VAKTAVLFYKYKMRWLAGSPSLHPNMGGKIP